MDNYIKRNCESLHVLHDALICSKETCKFIAISHYQKNNNHGGYDHERESSGSRYFDL
jgi:hypothetical protein